MENNYTITKRRLYAIILAATFVFVLLIFRVGYIQLIWGKQLQSKAIDQWTRDLPLVAKRGDILDTNGNVVVTSQTTYSVYLRARNISDANVVSTVLSQQLQLPFDWVYKRATNKNVAEVTIKKQVDSKIAAEIRRHNFNGVYFVADFERSYNYGDLLTQVLGMVSIDSVGQTGIEQYYNKYLSGINGSVYTQTDLIGIEQLDKPAYYVPAIDGLDVTLTIDLTIQRVVESVLGLIMQGHSPKGARAIVMDCENGEILAMANKPSYDMNNQPREDIQLLMEYSRNCLVTDIYEPGSTFKVLTASASLEEYKLGNSKAFSAQHIFRNNADCRVIDGSKINCWTKHLNGKHSNQTLSMALNNSCNPIFTDIALSLGKDTIYKYLDKFGYGNKTGIDFVGEQSGMLVDRSKVTNGDLARIGFGQTIAVTAIQLINATAAAVNGGNLYKPHLVKNIDREDEKVFANNPTLISHPISVETSKIIASMLQDVVTIGSGKQCYIDGYQVGGKTGTAQKYNDKGQVADGKYVSSFVGFFPASSPKYIALIIVDEPVGAHYGSTVAAPYAKLIFQQIINYKDIKPIK